MIKKIRISSIFKSASFPTIMTILSFVLFIIVYYLVTMTTIESYYFTGLLFAVPFFCFGIITVFTAWGKIDMVTSVVVTVILMIAFGLASLFLLVSLSFESATTVTTDISKYERVLKLTGYPTDELTKYFPEELPAGAKNAQFRYHPAWIQGGETCSLKFEMDPESIENSMNQFSARAKWIGSPTANEAGEYGIFEGSLHVFDYTATDLPNDLILYLMDSRPYHPNDWNHGSCSLIAISKQKNEILFMADDW